MRDGGGDRASRSLRLGALAIAAVASAALFAETRHYGLLGFDTYPLIETARVTSIADFVGLASERLMDGRYPSGFHRPVTSASFALDHALWGLDAFGYQLSNVLVFAAILLALFAVGVQLGGARAPALTLGAPLLFALHPSFYEIVPIPARRADLLSCAFGVGALAMGLGGRVRATAGLVLLAIGAKESGYAMAVLACAAIAVAPALEEPARAGIRGAALRAAPVAAAALLMLGVRLALLDGFGGHRELGLFEALGAAPGIAWQLVVGVALPQAPMLGRGFAVLLVGSLIAAAVAIALGPRPLPRGGVASVAVSLGWIAALALTYASAGWVGSWYYMVSTVGWAIGVAALLAWMTSLLRDGRGATRWFAAVAALGLLTAVFEHARLTPYFHNYGEWARATAVSEDFLATLSERIEASPDGALIEGPPLPMWAASTEGIPSVHGAAILSDYSVQAWADLVYPGRRIRILGVVHGVLPMEPAEPAPDELVIALPRRLVGY